MTIQEAIKSGKPFKRNGWDKWYFISPSGRIYCEPNENARVIAKESVSTNANDILAEDWETKP